MSTIFSPSRWGTLGAPIQTPLIDHPWVIVASNPSVAETKVVGHYKRRREAENTKQELEREMPEFLWEMISSKELAARLRPAYQ
jgi:hypothetical protein